jgi:S-adenosylmethionine:tRNA ribosyltransferase-isomerase
VRTSELAYELPDSAIARHPAAERDASRLLVVGRVGYEHRRTRDLADLVPEGSLVVVNDTRVLRARLFGRRDPSGGKVELLLLRRVAGEGREEVWRALGRASKPLLRGAALVLGDGDALRAEVIEDASSGALTVRLRGAEDVATLIERHGAVPLPPYLGREAEPADAWRYQTTFAREPGSVAAPTAGLHFDEAFFNRLAARGIQRAAVTLHVGLGTFRPVTVDDLDRHPMHEEEYEISEATSRAIEAARARGGRVAAIGTTAVRALESAADLARPGLVRAQRGETRLLLQPGSEIRVVDALLTNFHQPESTLLALVAAFIGVLRLHESYRLALAEGYRFLSYGDAMWIPERIA